MIRHSLWKGSLSVVLWNPRWGIALTPLNEGLGSVSASVASRILVTESETVVCEPAVVPQRLSRPDGAGVVHHSSTIKQSVVSLISRMRPSLNTPAIL